MVSKASERVTGGERLWYQEKGNRELPKAFPVVFRQINEPFPTALNASMLGGLYGLGQRPAAI